MVTRMPVSVAGTLLFILIATLTPGISQWNKKPYSEWSAREAEKLLNDSPWGKADIFSSPSELFGRTPSGGPAAAASQKPDAPNATQVYFRIRFFSAKPIRLAVSRLMELKSKGPRAAEFEKLLSTLRTGEFLEYIVLTVTLDSSGSGANVQEALGLLHSRGTADIQQNTYLETRGGRRAYLLEYQIPREDGMGARFIFPRVVDGTPFITEESGEIHFVAELSSTYKLDKRFKVKDMIYEGKLEY